MCIRDTYYGVHAFKMAYDFLTSEQEKEDVYHYMMVGYRLENTLTAVSYTHLDVYKRQPYIQ